MKRSPENTPEKKKSRRGKIRLLPALLSLLLAFSLWLYVASTESPTGQKTVSDIEVKIVGADTLSNTYGFSILSGYDATAEVTLSGKQSALNALTDGAVTARVDVSDITAAGSYTKSIQVIPPSGMSVVRCSPDTIVVDVDVKESVSVPVLEPEETFALPEGVNFTRSYSAESVQVTGPKTVVDSIYGVRCQVELGEFTQSVTKSVPIRFVDKENNEITDPYLVPNPSTLAVTYTLYKEKTVPLVLDVKALLEGEKITQRVTPEKVTVQVAPEEYDDLTEIVVKTLTSADINGAESTFTGTVELPDGVVSPVGTIKYEAALSLSGSLSTTANLDLSGENVNVSVPEGMKYSFAQDSANISLRVRRGALSGLDISQLEASVNLSSFTEPGTYTVPLSLAVPEELSDVCYVTGSVNVKVTLTR